MPAVLVEAGFLNTEADNQIFDEQFDEVAQAIANGILRTLQMGEMEYAQQPERTERQQTQEEWYMENREEMPGDSRDWTQESRGCSCGNEKKYYRVQTGAFQNQAYAEDQLYQLLQQNYPAYILIEDGLYKVQVGAFLQLDNAVRMEQALRQKGYPTFIVT